MNRQRCQTCGHECVASITAKCSDLFGIRWPGGREQTGYVPPHDLTGLRENGASSDYVNLSYCLVCGQIQGEWPVKGAGGYLNNYVRMRTWRFVALLSEDRYEDVMVQSHTEFEARKEVERQFKHATVVLVGWDEVE